MSLLRHSASICFVILLCWSSGLAQQPLTLDQTLSIARQRAPQIVSAAERINEARGRLAGASILFQENPVVELSAGPRISSTRTTTDYDISLSQPIELGGRRAARIEGANAGIERESAAARDITRKLLRDVSGAFVRGLTAQERLRLASDAAGIANELYATMQRRYEAGDVPVLDVNLARSSAARARSEVHSAQAAVATALGDLRILLGMRGDEPLSIVGDLKDRPRCELESLLVGTSHRPDLAALGADLQQSQADVKLGRGFRWPSVAPGVSYKRDQGDNIYQGGLTFTLPVFNRGQELQAVGQARSNRLQREIAYTRSAVEVEVRAALDVYNAQIDAVEELERNAIPNLNENETLARRSFEEGEIGLAELLLIRRDAFETRLIYTDRLLDAALAGIELKSRAGVLR